MFCLNNEPISLAHISCCLIILFSSEIIKNKVNNIFDMMSVYIKFSYPENVWLINYIIRFYLAPYIIKSVSMSIKQIHVDFLKFLIGVQRIICSIV